MKIVQFGIGAAACVTLSGCTGLVTMPKLEGCYPLDALSVWEQAALHARSGNPILLLGGKRFVCTCYNGRAGERGELGKADEQGALGRADEQGELGRADEQSALGRADEQGALGRADEQGELGRADEQGALGRADEQGELGRADEQGVLGRADEQGRAAEFSCRIVPECPGFQLIGYGPKDVTVLTPAGQKSVSASCITW